MRQRLYIGKEPDFQKIIIASAVLHLLFIALITVPLKTREREYKTYYVNIVPPSEIRDTARPSTVKKKGTAVKKAKTAKKTVTVKPTPRKRTRARKGVNLESPDRVKKEIERLKAISTLAKLKKKKEEELARAEEEEETLSDAIESIRKKKKIIDISKRSGMFGNVAANETDAYSALVQQRITDEWIQYQTYDSSPETIVSFTINIKGEIVAPRIVKSSGSGIFDMSVMKAVKKASPLPPPAVENEYELRFHL